MKQKDLTLIAVIIIVSALISIILSSVLISSPKNRQQKVEVVEPISAEFTRPDEKFFNKTSLNPTQLIQIGNASNTKPFNGQ